MAVAVRCLLSEIRALKYLDEFSSKYTVDLIGGLHEQDIDSVLCASKLKFIGAQTRTMLVLDKRTSLSSIYESLQNTVYSLQNCLKSSVEKKNILFCISCMRVHNVSCKHGHFSPELFFKKKIMFCLQYFLRPPCLGVCAVRIVLMCAVQCVPFFLVRLD
jgi:hypothetical protein